MRILIEARDVKLCKEFASFRRTLNEAIRLLEAADFSHATNEPIYEDEVQSCLAEMREITPTVEALQFAVREGK
jgi:hypothetical protein